MHHVHSGIGKTTASRKAFFFLHPTSCSLSFRRRVRDLHSRSCDVWWAQAGTGSRPGVAAGAAVPFRAGQQSLATQPVSPHRPRPRGARGAAKGHSAPCPHDLKADRNRRGYPLNRLVPSLPSFLGCFFLLNFFSRTWAQQQEALGAQSGRPGLAAKTTENVQVSTTRTYRSLSLLARAAMALSLRLCRGLCVASLFPSVHPNLVKTPTNPHFLKKK